MRALLLLTLFGALGCRGFFEPPCVQLSRPVCQLPDQGDACAFVLHVERGDEREQQVCRALLPAARALEAGRGSPEARATWAKARTQLEALGMPVDPEKGRLENKLKAAGGMAGRAVQQLQDATKLEEDHVNDAAAKVLDDAQH